LGVISRKPDKRQPLNRSSNSAKAWKLDSGCRRARELVPIVRAAEWEGTELTQQSLKLSFRMNRMLCDTWNRIAASAGESPEGQAEIATARQKLKCSTP
jgi:hypothetical protein